MTRAPAHLQLVRQADADLAARAPVAVTGAEALLVDWVADLLEAPAGTTGRVVTGAVEAALLVVRGARDAHGRTGGSVVLPSSAHPAWSTAAVAAGLDPVVVPVGLDGRAGVGAVTAAIRDDTVLVVASAPSYTHGVVDPVGWLAAATEAKGVALHVDATSGGWSLAYAGRAGRVGPSWGFAVAGVGSVGLDVGPESGGPSDLAVVLHRDGALDRTAGWTGPGPLVVDAVETLREIGHDGCDELAAGALEATATVVAAADDLPGVQVAAPPAGTVVTLRCDATCDAFTLADALRVRGWTTSPVLPEWGPPLLRLPVTAASTPVAAHLLAALSDAVAEARAVGRAHVDPTLARLVAGAAPGGRDTLLAVRHGRLLRPVPSPAQAPATRASTLDSE